MSKRHYCRNCVYWKRKKERNGGGGLCLWMKTLTEWPSWFTPEYPRTKALFGSFCVTFKSKEDQTEEGVDKTKLDKKK
jgi:hypothetical protein